MTQIVKACVRASYLRRRRFEAFESRLRVYKMPDFVREYKFPFVFPRFAHSRVILELLAPDIFQQFHDERRDGENARFVVLRRGDIVNAAFCLVPAELLFDRDRTVAEVDRVPRQAAYLALAHSREERDCEELAQRLSLSDQGEKRSDFILGEGLYFVLLDAGKRAGVGGVYADIAQLQRLFKRAVKDPVNVLYRFRGKPLSRRSEL